MSRRELKDLAKEQLRGRWLIIILASVFCGIFTNTTYSSEFLKFANQESLSLILPIGSLFLGGVFSVGLSKFALNFTRKDLEPNFKDVFSAFPIYLKTLGLFLLSGIIVLLGTILLVVPGIIAALALSQANYILADNPEKGVVECLQESYNMMKGHKGEYFVLQLSFFGWALLCALTLGIGFLWLSPYMLMTNTNYYLSIKNSREAY